jgi:DNA-binding response OmpR family regulator
MKRILVIDDREGVRSMLASTLAQFGYSVRQAQDGREGIRMVIDLKPDLIICDVRMPGFDGYRTLEAIRKCPGTASICFILMSGSTGRDDFRHGMVAGADDYLMKPFSAAELKAAVKSRLARQADVRLDTNHRATMRHLEELQDLSKELAGPINGILSLVADKLRYNQVPDEIALPVAQISGPVFRLD